MPAPVQQNVAYQGGYDANFNISMGMAPPKEEPSFLDSFAKKEDELMMDPNARISTFEEVKTLTKTLSEKTEALIKDRVKMSKDFREKLAPNMLNFIDNKDLRVRNDSLNVVENPHSPAFQDQRTRRLQDSEGRGEV